MFNIQEREKARCITSAVKISSIESDAKWQFQTPISPQKQKKKKTEKKQHQMLVRLLWQALNYTGRGANPWPDSPYRLEPNLVVLCFRLTVPIQLINRLGWPWGMHAIQPSTWIRASQLNPKLTLEFSIWVGISNPINEPGLIQCKAITLNEFVCVNLNS